MKKLYRLDWNYGRMGSVQGLFVADEENVKEAFGKTVYFGEVLGKHSDVSGELDKEDLEIVSEDEVFITKLVEVIGKTNISGYNPLDYLEE